MAPHRALMSTGQQEAERRQRFAIRHRIAALPKIRWHIFQSVRPGWERGASLSTLILRDSGPFGIIYSQSGPGALRGQRSALGHSYRHNPGALSPPSVCSLRLGQTRAKVKAHTVGERDFPQFSGHWTLNNAVLVGLACAIFHPQLIPPHRTTPSLAFVAAASAEAESREPFQPFPFFFFLNDWNSLLNTMVAISFALKCDLRVS